MSREEIVALFERREEGWRRHDPKVLVEAYAPDAVVESPVSGTSTGVREIEESYQRLFGYWSPLEHVLEELIVEGDRVVTSFEMRGTHSGEFFRQEVHPSRCQPDDRYRRVDRAGASGLRLQRSFGALGGAQGDAGTLVSGG